MVEASSSIKKLDLPSKHIRSNTLLSSHDASKKSQDLQSEMDLVNKKIDKAKLSIS